MPSIWNEWLPEHLAEEVRIEEPRRFSALIHALAEVWQREKAAKPADTAASATLPYVPLVKAMLNTKAEPPHSDIQLLVETLLDLVLTCHSDLVAQARWCILLHRLLRSHRRKLKLSIPWRPFFTMLRRQYMLPAASVEGAGISELRRSALVGVVHRARRFFPPGTAEEVWAEFSPTLRDVHRSESFEALGWLALFMPTQAALKGDGSFAQWAPEWLHLWAMVPHNHFWEAQWAGLFCRLVKHDTNGVVDWPTLLPQLTTRLMWAFNLPVGTATASPPFQGTAPGLVQVMFSGDMTSRPAAVAHIMLYLLGRCPLGPLGNADPALCALESMTALLEQYYHPSNGGKWTGALTSFLKEAAGQLCHRLVAEHHATARLAAAAAAAAAPGGGHAAGVLDEDMDGESGADDDDAGSSDDEDATGSEDGEEMGGDESGTDGDDEYAAAAPPQGPGSTGEAASAASPSSRRPLTQETVNRVVSALLPLAAKGQSSKDRHLKRASSFALAQMAHVAPNLVLPVVHRHFITALNTVTAARQYVNAIQTLSLCVRPLLLAGLQPPEDEASMGEAAAAGEGCIAAARAAAAASIASAMAATLPGIDANDPPKSLAVFRLYCCVLSCVSELPEHADAGALPLFTEDWAFELLSRIFTIIANLDAPDASGEHGAAGGEAAAGETPSFLLEGSSMFRPLTELLYARLPAPLRAPAIRRTAAFLLENTFTSVTAEAAILCNAVAWADPKTSTEVLLVPLLAALERDAAAFDPGATRLSKVAETALKWRLSLLSSTVYHLGAPLVGHGKRLLAVIRSMFAAPSQAVQEGAARALVSTLAGLTSYFPVGQYEVCSARLEPQIGGGSGAVEEVAMHTNGENGCASGVQVDAFVDSSGGGMGAALKPGESSMSWHIPNADEIALANEFLAEFLEAPALKLLAGGDLGKDALRSLLLQIEGAIGGVRSCLPDFPECVPFAVPGPSAAVVGAAGPPVGSPQLRQLAAEAVEAASRAAGATDAENLGLCLRVMDLLISAGSSEYADAAASGGAWFSDDKWMHEPPVAGALLEALGDVEVVVVGGQEGGKGEKKGGLGPKWRRRRPMWLAKERVFLSLEWRASQAAYRWFASAAAPLLPRSALPPAFLSLVARSVHFSMQGPRRVRDSAAMVLERAMKRYPDLAPAVLAPIFSGMAKVDTKLVFDPSVTTADAVPWLRAAAQAAAAKAAAAAGEAESEQEQGMMAASSSLVRFVSIWRHVTRDWQGLRALTLALMASAAHTGVESQMTVLMASLMLSFRYIKPPGESQIAEAICEDAMAAATGVALASQSGAGDGGEDAAAGAAPQLPWRYVAAANCYPLLLLPAVAPESAGKLMTHYVNTLLSSEVVITRTVSALAINTMVLPLWNPRASLEGGMGPEAVAAAKAALTAAAGTMSMPKLLDNLGHAHAALVGGPEAQTLRLMSRDEAPAKALISTLARASEWPSQRTSVEAVDAAHFMAYHARLVQILAQVAPDYVIPALRAPIEAALSRPQDADRPALAAAAEALAGLAASPAAHSHVDWAEWIAPTLAKAMSAAPLDVTPTWSAVLQFALNNLSTTGHEALVPALLDIAMATTVNGAQQAEKASMAAAAAVAGGSEASAATFKRVTYAADALDEMLGTSGGGTLPAAVRALLGWCLAELPSLTLVSGEMVRRAAAGLAADISSALLAPAIDVAGSSARQSSEKYRSSGGGSTSEVQSKEELQAAAAAFVDHLGTQFDAATAVLHARTRAMGAAAGAGGSNGKGGAAASDDAAVLAAADAAMAAAELANGAGLRPMEAEVDSEGSGEEGEEEEMESADKEAAEMEVERLEGGIHFPFDATSAAPVSAEEEAYQAAVGQVAFCVEFVLQMLASHPSTAVTPLVVRLLPSLLRLQDLVPSELQFVALVAKKSLIAAKYQPLGVEEAGATLRALRAASRAELWPERAAALVYSQFFWFRHALLLGKDGTAAVLEMVLERLEDDKLEVRELASATLSGVIRGLPHEEAAALRERFLARAAELFPARRRRRAPTAVAPTQEERNGAAAALPARHGAALALHALVLSSPYDVPPWLPDVLMALVRLASQPAPVKGTVAKALSEFRRTHEEGGLAEAKEALTQEQWEAIRDVASPASYFV